MFAGTGDLLGRPTVLMLYSNSTLLMLLKVGPTKGRKATEVRLSLGLSPSEVDR
jgi:hypothetical protein